MTRDRDPPIRRPVDDDPDGWLEGVVADEEGADRSVFWRMSAWGVAAAAAVTLGFASNRLDLDPWAGQATAKYFETKTAQVETVSREAQFEARRLAAAIETLNSDRDRIYARLSSVEQGFESVTGSIKAQELAIAKIPPRPVEAPPPPVIHAAPSSPSPQQDQASSPQSAQKPPAAGNALDRTGSIELAPEAANASVHPKATDTPVPATEFGIDLGASASLDGLRSIWQTTSSVHKAALTGLTPIVTIEERGAKQPPRFRLVAGPLRNAADAARLCVLLMEKAKDCKTRTYEGQRLQISNQIVEPPPVRPPASTAPQKQGPRSATSGTRSASALPAQVTVRPSGSGP